MPTRTAARSPEGLHPPELPACLHLVGPLAAIQPAGWPGGDPPELSHLAGPGLDADQDGRPMPGGCDPPELPERLHLVERASMPPACLPGGEPDNRPPRIGSFLGFPDAGHSPRPLALVGVHRKR